MSHILLPPSTNIVAWPTQLYETINPQSSLQRSRKTGRINALGTIYMNMCLLRIKQSDNEDIRRNAAAPLGGQDVRVQAGKPVRAPAFGTGDQYTQEKREQPGAEVCGCASRLVGCAPCFRRWMFRAASLSVGLKSAALSSGLPVCLVCRCVWSAAVRKSTRCGEIPFHSTSLCIWQKSPHDGAVMCGVRSMSIISYLTKIHQRHPIRISQGPKTRRASFLLPALLCCRPPSEPFRYSSPSNQHVYCRHRKNKRAKGMRKLGGGTRRRAFAASADGVMVASEPSTAQLMPLDW
ncbi:hypothetical protein GMOD_00002623 [Pyrenophora seminiperda CCB06]|uniref:Uncharacterized protein n=1 Tax=Pyrenophora seminiperda CCB06 TaxID=1302712 RepID=A0A3M7M2M1_9PLEO|nr:hypothetical protein GMOD_00002623 [Pyrenophora seminiperda CCB06]